MNAEKARDNFAQSLAENAYLNMCTAEEMKITIEALEKQIPKKPIKVMDSGIRYTDEYICPACENHFTGTGIADYCYHCGQAIEWEESE